MNDLEAVLITAGLAFLFISFIVERGVVHRVLALILGFILIISGVSVYTGWLPRVQGHTPLKSKSQIPKS